MKRTKILGAAGVLVAAWVISALPATAQEKIDESFDLDKDGRVTISNVTGFVQVTGWDRGRVEVRGTLGRGSERLSVEHTANRAEIKVKIPRHARDVEETILEIRVPMECDLEVHTVSAEIDVDDFEGDLSLESVSGDVTAGSKPARVEVETVSGEIDLEVECGRVTANTVSGDILVFGGDGEVSVETVSGDATIRGGEFTVVEFSSVSGDLTFEGDLVRDGSYSFDSHSGDLDLFFPSDTDAEFEISTFSGTIDSEFSMRGRWGSSSGPGKELRFTVGSGDAEVSIETFSGDIRLEKR